MGLFERRLSHRFCFPLLALLPFSTISQPSSVLPCSPLWGSLLLSLHIPRRTRGIASFYDFPSNMLFNLFHHSLAKFRDDEHELHGCTHAMITRFITSPFQARNKCESHLLIKCSQHYCHSSVISSFFFLSGNHNNSGGTIDYHRQSFCMNDWRIHNKTERNFCNIRHGEKLFLQAPALTKTERGSERDTIESSSLWWMSQVNAAWTLERDWFCDWVRYAARQKRHRKEKITKVFSILLVLLYYS